MVEQVKPASRNMTRGYSAGLEARILHRLEKDGKIDETKIRVLDSREVLGYPWVAPESLPAGFRDRIVAAFQAITDPAPP